MIDWEIFCSYSGKLVALLRNMEDTTKNIEAIHHVFNQNPKTFISVSNYSEEEVMAIRKSSFLS